MKPITHGNTAPASSASSTQNSSHSRGSGFVAPTEEQQAAIDGVLDFALRSSGNFASLVGPAGSGKSTVSRLIRQALITAGKTVG